MFWEQANERPYQLSVVPNSWFGVFDDMAPIILQASLDGTYSAARGVNGRRVFAYGGLAGFDDAWRAFDPHWRSLLTVHDLEYFRTSEARACHGFDELRSGLVEGLRQCGLHAVGSAIEMDLSAEKTNAGRKRDVFEHCVRQVLRVTPNAANVALVCDREQDLAKQVAIWIDRLEWEARQRGRVDRFYERVVGICYLNSRFSMQVQAADLVSSLFREYAEEQLRSPGSPAPQLLNRLTEGRITHKMMSTTEFLADLAD